IPGATTRPSASSSRAPRPSTKPTSAILPLLTATSARRRGSPVPSTTTPLRITRSWSATAGQTRTRSSFQQELATFVHRLHGRTSRCTSVAPGSAGPDDALELGVGVQAERAAVAADAGLLEPAERGLVVALRGVDADVARPQLLRHPHGPRRVRREDVVVQPELGAVGQRDPLVLVVEGHDDHDGTEDLLLHHLHAGLAI